MLGGGWLAEGELEEVRTFLLHFVRLYATLALPFCVLKVSVEMTSLPESKVY